MITLLNPIRFQRIDYQTNQLSGFYTPNTSIPRETAYKGREALPYDHEFLINNVLSIQISESYSGEFQESYIITPDNQQVNLTPTSITPAGHTGGGIWSKIEYTPTSEGLYKMRINFEYNYYYAEFFVLSFEKMQTKAIAIQYTNTFNDFDTIFVDDVVNKYTAITFFEGVYFESQGETQRNVLKDSAGNQILTRNQTIKGRVIVIDNIPAYYEDYIRAIFGCNQITINNSEQVTADEIAVEGIPKTDNVKITIQCTLKNNTYLI